MGSTAGVYFARREHGGHRVIGTPTGFRVAWPDGTVMYPSARQTIMALVNGTKTPHTKTRDPHLTFDRYFRIGRHARRSYPAIDTLALFHPSSPLSVWVQDTTSPISVAVTPTLVKTPLEWISTSAGTRYASCSMRDSVEGFTVTDTTPKTCFKRFTKGSSFAIWGNVPLIRLNLLLGTTSTWSVGVSSAITIAVTLVYGEMKSLG